MNLTPEIVARFVVKVDRRGVSECWPWLAAIGGQTGYGVFSIGHQNYSAHRVAYTLWVGPIPDGLHIDHVRTRGCTSRACVNPSHLEAVTQTENNRRTARDRCKRGHVYAVVGRYAGQKCAACGRASANARYAAKKQRAKELATA